MRLKVLVLSVLIMVLFTGTAMAGAGKGPVLNAKSESGKVQLTVVMADVDGPVTSAKLVTEQGTVDLMADYSPYSVIDVPNHILTICFVQKGKMTGDDDAKEIKVWAIPSSFVNIVNSNQFHWKLRLKVGGNALKEVDKLSGTFEWNP